MYKISEKEKKNYYTYKKLTKAVKKNFNTYKHATAAWLMWYGCNQKNKVYKNV